MQHANRAFDNAESQNADNLCYEPYPADAPKHLGLIGGAVLAGRADIRGAVAPAIDAPAPGPRPRLELLRAERNAPRRSALDEALAPLLELAGPLRTSAERDAIAAY